MYFNVPDVKITPYLTPNKRIKPVTYSLLPNSCVWVGALARLEMIEGTYKFLSFFFGEMITIHKSSVDKVERLY